MESLFDAVKSLRLTSLQDLMVLPINSLEKLLGWLSSPSLLSPTPTSNLTHTHTHITTLLYVCVFVVVVLLYKYVYCKNTPKLTHVQNKKNEQILSKVPLLHSEYHMPLWGTWGAAQTMYVSAVRRATMPTYKREMLDAGDGGVVVLDVVHPQQQQQQEQQQQQQQQKQTQETKQQPKTIVVIVPGICNNSDSHYVRHFSALCAQNGHMAVIFHPRGSSSTEIKTPKLFTWGDTHDFHVTLQHLHNQHPQAKLFLIGFSLGGNVVVKYMGVYGSELQATNVCGGMSVCQGYDAEKAVQNVRHLPFWNFGLTAKLKKLLKRHSHMFKEMMDMEHLIKRVNSVEDFDRHFTMKVHGFESLEAYYQQHSCVHYLHGVKQPLLLLNALDDPIVPEFLLPYNAARDNENIILATTKNGGHLGFIEGNILPKKTHWHERVALEFLEACADWKQQHQQQQQHHKQAKHHQQPQREELSMPHT